MDKHFFSFQKYTIKIPSSKIIRFTLWEELMTLFKTKLILLLPLYSLVNT